MEDIDLYALYKPILDTGKWPCCTSEVKKRSQKVKGTTSRIGGYA